MRVCVLYAGINVSEFSTATEAAALLKTGAFEEMTGTKYTNSSDYLKRGDILVTKTKGHTVVVLSDGAKVTQPKKSLDEIAQEVIDGKWHNGAARRSALKAAGYDPDEVQKRVNEILEGKSLAGTYKVTAPYGLNVRKDPSIYGSVIDVLDHDDRVYCDGYYKDNDDIRWMRVKYGKTTGFCSNKFLQKV